MDKNLIEQIIVIIAEFFNPSVFNQYWFIKEGLLKEEDIQKESLFVPGITHIQTNKFNMLVIPEKIQITLKCNEEEACEIVCNMLTKIAQYQANIPYKALGLNYCWKLEPKESISIFSRNIFCKKDIELYKAFNEEDARFGTYISQNYKKSRMNLDIKPVFWADKECMICNFNFHHEVSNTNDIIEYQQFWKEYLDKTKEIVNYL